jgi:hypothetical protein
MAFTDLLNGAPLFLQRRYGSIRAHVKSVIESEYPDIDQRSIPREDIEFIQVIAFVYVLQGFFVDGHKAAEGAVTILQDLGVHSFKIGSAQFAPRSEAVMLGKKLADQLLDQIKDESLRNLISTTTSLGELVRKLFEGLGHGKVDI